MRAELNLNKFVDHIVYRLASLISSAKSCTVSFGYSVFEFSSRQEKALIRRILQTLIPLGLYAKITSHGTRFFIFCDSRLYETIVSNPDELKKHILRSLLS